jgi:large subunit ribosomal protein L30
MKRTSQLKVTLRRSSIGRPKTQRRVLESLGLRKLHWSKVFDDSPMIRGMIDKVAHLVDVEKMEKGA